MTNSVYPDIREEHARANQQKKTRQQMRTAKGCSEVQPDNVATRREVPRVPSRRIKVPPFGRCPNDKDQSCS